MLKAGRISFQGETPYAHERDGLECIFQGLPDRDPFHLWALVDLFDPTTARFYEIDALLLGENLKRFQAGCSEGGCLPSRGPTPRKPRSLNETIPKTAASSL